MRLPCDNDRRLFFSWKPTGKFRSSNFALLLAFFQQNFGSELGRWTPHKFLSGPFHSFQLIELCANRGQNVEREKNVKINGRHKQAGSSLESLFYGWEMFVKDSFNSISWAKFSFRVVKIVGTTTVKTRERENWLENLWLYNEFIGSFDLSRGVGC